MPAKPDTTSSRGFSMVETLVALAVIGLFMAALSYIIQAILDQITISRIQSVALSLARETIEEARNVPYDQVGTVGGIPLGPIDPLKTTSVNGQTFQTETSIFYVDDPFDGQTPVDIINTDYKRIRVQVTWGGPHASRKPVTLVSTIVPKGVETIAGGGTLFIQVFNSLGEPVPGATVLIDNTSVTPEIHTQTLTSSLGTVVIPGAPDCVQCYRVSATKSGYSLERTYAESEVANPLLPDLTVLEGEVTQASLAISQLSTIKVESKSPTGSTVTNVYFTIRGDKLIGYDEFDDPVYKYTYTTNTGGGTITVVNLESDTYTLDFSSSAYNLAGSNPILPYVLTAATNGSLTIVVTPKTQASYLVIVRDTSLVPQASASATLSSVPPGYVSSLVTQATGSATYGQVFFNSLSLGTYTLLVSLPGFQDATSSVSISGNQQDSVILNQYVP